MNEIRRPVWLEINLDNLEYNFNNIKENVDKDTIIMPVIKANAYGHGAVEVAKLYQKLGVKRLAVSILQEAIELRRHKIDASILILNYTPKDTLGYIVDYDLTPTIYTLDAAKRLSEIAVQKDKKVKIHIKIESGMTRLGFPSRDKNTVLTINEINKLPNLIIEGIYTHFARAEEPEIETTSKQLKKFEDTIKALENIGIDISIKHVSNSAAIIYFSHYKFDMIRPGLILYGYYPTKDTYTNGIDLKPAMTLKAEVSNVKKEGKIKIATLPIGYGDGYSRMLSEGGFVSIKDERAPIIEPIYMDQMMIDITDIDGVEVGDGVVLFGYEKASFPKLHDLEGIIGTIDSEIMVMMNRRIPRKYLRKGRLVETVDYLLNEFI